MRCDANVNLHIDTPEGQVATPIVEIKNMNSFRAVERAIEYEAERHFKVWQDNNAWRIGKVAKQTRGWDDAAGKTLEQRSKEDSSDYRYFPDPDLVPVLSTLEQVEEVRSSLGDLPADIRRKLSEDHGLSAYDADVLVNQGRDVLDYFFEAATSSGDYKAACNWVTQDIQRILKEREQSINDFPINAGQLAELISAVNNNELPKSRSKDAFELMVEGGIDVTAAIKKLGIEQVDESALVSLCQELLDANPKIVADVKGGKQQAVGSLIGQAKNKNPNVDPGQVRKICLELVEKL